MTQATSRPDYQEDREWRRAVLFALPSASLAFLLGALLDGPSGQSTAFDRITYPSASLLVALLELALLCFPRSLRAVASSLAVGISVFFLAKLVFVLFLLPNPAHVQTEMTETFFWIPSLLVISFFIPELKFARQIAIGFFTLFALISVTYLVRSAFLPVPLGNAFALIELNLANITLTVMTSIFIGFKEQHTRSLAETATVRTLLVTDLLTGIPNRRFLMDTLQRVLNAGTECAVVFIDMDGFKRVNDTFGHSFGDQVLKEVARRLHSLASQEVVAARLSGDEFILLVTGTSPKAHTVATSALQVLSQPYAHDGQLVHLSASIGISCAPGDSCDPLELLQHADSAMYRAKLSGKNVIQPFDLHLAALIERSRVIEHALNQALPDQQLSLVFQPIYSLDNGNVGKLEALLRWNHPVLGAVAPSDFIPVAERTGQIVALGTWVLAEACRQARRWRDQHGVAVTISVNVSPLQFLQPDFVEKVLSLLDAEHLPTSAIELELTETAFMRDPDRVLASLVTLRARGITIAIDDFGTGYSSLSYLQRLPVDVIKIDQSFVRELDAEGQASSFALALIEAVAGLAGKMQFRVVAEGIETERQLAVLRTLGCPFGQGYLLSRPLVAGDVVGYLHAHNLSLEA